MLQAKLHQIPLYRRSADSVPKGRHRVIYSILTDKQNWLPFPSICPAPTLKSPLTFLALKDHTAEMLPAFWLLLGQCLASSQRFWLWL